MAFKVYILTPLIAALVIPVAVLAGGIIFYFLGAEFTEESLKEAAMVTLGAYVIMFLFFLFRQLHVIGKIKRKTGLTLEEIAKLPKDQQARIANERDEEK